MSIARRLQGREIRLVSIVTEEPGKALQCTSKIVDLDDNFDYDALSYVWGDARSGTDIHISGRLLSIQVNLESALRYLRGRIPGRWLWIDQLCINQEDTEEKSHQVSLMSDIYQRASMTYAYLHYFGPSEQELDIVSILTHLRDCAGRDLSGLALSPWWWNILRMLRHEWWERVWTAQEMILAKNLTFIYCGKTLSYALLLEFFQIFLQLEDITKVIRLSEDLSNVGLIREVKMYVRKHLKMVDIKQRVAKHGQTTDLINLLSVCRDRKTSNLVDKVYGLAGLYPFPPRFVDYQVSPQKCFERLTVLIIREHQSLNIFHHILSDDLSGGTQMYESYDSRRVQDRVRLPNLPSWVPDWSQKFNSRYRTLLEARLQLLRAFNTTRSLKPQIKSCDDGELSVKGILCDVVKKVNEGKDWDLQGRNKTSLESCIRLAGLENHDPFDVEYTQFREALTAGVTLTSVTGSLSISKLNNTIHPFVHDVWLTKTLEDGLYPRSAELRTLNDVDYYAETVDTFATERRFICTAAGLLGWAPRNTQEGDIVCALFGSSTPFVLRPSLKRVGKWQLVGDAVLQGYMWGEVLIAVDEGRLQPSEFVIT